MKAGVCNQVKRYRYGILALTALGCSALAGYSLFFKPQIPECRAVMHVTDSVGGRSVDRVVLVGIVPDGRRRITLLLNGRVNDGNNRYVIERIVIMEYRRQGSNYTLHVEKSIRKAFDSLEPGNLNRRLPAEGQLLHWRIERIDSRHFLFVDNHAPLFVCSTL
ncbi:hypothetical protein [Serratia marcescens]|uniref:hypothetical protein n=1 Tax=Serratia marcescens TaxID=615 RepID=UPI00237FE03E|nr:hypothetical protein [Serratia marcescens]